MDSRPQLEIYADDVKVQSLERLFASSTRMRFFYMHEGIGKREARLLLMFAFAHRSFRT